MSLITGPQYDPLPEVLHDDGIPAFPSLNAMNKTCSEINFWGRPLGGGYFIWDFKGPLIMSRVEFRNHYHYSHYRCVSGTGFNAQKFGFVQEPLYREMLALSNLTITFVSSGV